jgi:hypothetical protein
MAKIFVSFNIVSTADFLLIAREKEFPLAEVYRSDLLEPPHTQRNITIINLNPVMHSVELWTTTDGTTLEELRGQCDIDASLVNTSSYDFLQFIVDRGNGAPYYDPTSGSTQYVNPDLDGKDYLVFKPSYGPLVWGYHIAEITGGGFEFIDGQQFGADEEYTVMINNLVTTSSTTSGRGYPEDVVEITGDIAFGSTHYNKLIEVNGSSTLVEVDISNIDTIPEGTVFGINTHNGTQRYTVLQLPASKYCLIFGVQRNAVYVGAGEEVTFIKKGAYLRLVNWDGDYRRIGQRIECDGTAPANTLPESGGWYLHTDYPRIFNWYVDNLPPGELGAGADDITPDAGNITKWIIGATKFWVPDTRSRFVRNVPIGRLAGSNQADQVGSHTHPGVSAIPTGAHGSSSSALTGAIRFLVNTFASGGNNTATATLTVAENIGGAAENRPVEVAANFYRVI